MPPRLSPNVACGILLISSDLRSSTLIIRFSGAGVPRVYLGRKSYAATPSVGGIMGTRDHFYTVVPAYFLFFTLGETEGEKCLDNEWRRKESFVQRSLIIY